MRHRTPPWRRLVGDGQLWAKRRRAWVVLWEGYVILSLLMHSDPFGSSWTRTFWVCLMVAQVVWGLYCVVRNRDPFDTRTPDLARGAPST